MNNLSDTLEFLVKGIVANPETITVTSSQDGDLTILTVTAPEEIVGQLIGKQGKIIKSIRTILSIAYPDKKFSLDVNS